MQTEDFSYASAANEVFSRSGGDHAARHNPEDAYEAAMRAADALFSPAADKTPVTRRPESFTEQAADKAERPDGESETGDAAAPGGGRILRAIDEPVAALDDLEPEAAPKRRGRKPGSRNKPKAPVFVDDAPRILPEAWLDVEAAPEPASSGTPPMRSLPAAVARMVASTNEPSGYKAREDERFSWVRTKLKPGEEWKRRLPKVCW